MSTIKISYPQFTLLAIIAAIVVVTLLGFNPADEKKQEFLTVTLADAPREIQVSTATNYESFKVSLAEKNSVSPLLNKVSELQYEGWEVFQFTTTTMPGTQREIHTFLLKREKNK